MIEQCQRRKAQRENKELADKIFREPERREQGTCKERSCRA